MDETSEQRTIELCRKGDRNAQKALFDLLAPRMYPVCIRYVGDRETAQDILQDGFVTMFSKLDSYKGEGSFEGWARRIFVNTSLMYLRKKDALKMSDDLENARHLCSDMAGQMENIGYKKPDYMEIGVKTFKKIDLIDKLKGMLGTKIHVYVDKHIGTSYPDDKITKYKIHFKRQNKLFSA